MFCSYCGNEFNNNGGFCMRCGRKRETGVNNGGECPSCKERSREGALFCHNCGGTVSAYAPPEGFSLDAKSLLYYRSEETPGARWVTWFDPHTGEYNQVSYPREQPKPAQQPVKPAQITPATAQAPDTAGVLSGSAPPVKQKRKGLAAAICIGAAALVLGGLGVLAWQLHWFVIGGDAVASAPTRTQETAQTPEAALTPEAILAAIAPTPTPPPPTPTPETEPAPDPYADESYLVSFAMEMALYEAYASDVAAVFGLLEDESVLDHTEYGVNSSYASASAAYGNFFDLEYGELILLGTSTPGDCYVQMRYSIDGLDPEEVVQKWSDLEVFLEARFGQVLSRAHTDQYGATVDGYDYQDVFNMASDMYDIGVLRTRFEVEGINDFSLMIVRNNTTDIDLIVQIRTFDRPDATPEITGAEELERRAAEEQGVQPSPQGSVILQGLKMPEDLPEFEGILEIYDFTATPNGQGGYDCYVKIVNVSYGMESSVYCLLLGPNEHDVLDLTLAEDMYIDKGGEYDFYFEVPYDLVDDGDCTVIIEYTFWS